MMGRLQSQNAKSIMMRDGANTSGMNQGDFTDNTVAKVKSQLLPDFGELNNIQAAKSFY